MSQILPSRRKRILLERKFAATALALYGLDRPTYHLLTLSHAARFRVRTGEQYLLRLNNPAWHSASLVASELLWLTHLHHHTALTVPQPLRTADNRRVLELTLLDNGERRVASLFRWIAGYRRVNPVTASTTQCLGTTMARLHTAAMEFVPPAGFVRHDYHTDIFPHLAEHLEYADTMLLGVQEKRLCQDAFETVSASIQQLGRPSSLYGLIHGDTNLSNFLYQHNDVALVDFEVCCFGYYLYDVARTLNELASYKQSAELISGFYAGYQQLLPSLPAFTDTSLQIFRLVNYLEIVRWIITTPPQYQQAEMMPMLRQTLRRIEGIAVA
jgi:Ser/Thr protein kinase RdoA (MazF antagonist)